MFLGSKLEDKIMMTSIPRIQSALITITCWNIGFFQFRYSFT